LALAFVLWTRILELISCFSFCSSLQFLSLYSTGPCLEALVFTYLTLHFLCTSSSRFSLECSNRSILSSHCPFVFRQQCSLCNAFVCISTPKFPLQFFASFLPAFMVITLVPVKHISNDKMVEKISLPFFLVHERCLCTKLVFFTQ
jgi:hypothetical protein